MELIARGSYLHKAISIASKFTSPADSISNSILLTATHGGLEIRSTDLQQVCSIRVGCTVNQPGQILLPTRQAKAFSIDTEDDVTLRMRVKFEFIYPHHTFRSDTVDESPDFFPEHDISGGRIEILSSLFEPARGTIHIGGRPALECVYLMPGEDSSIISADGLVASRVYTNLPISDTVQIPGEFFFRAMSAVPGNNVLLSIGERRIGVSDPDETVNISFPAARIESVPDWDTVFAQEYDYSAELPPVTIRNIQTICTRTAEADDGAFAIIRVEDGQLHILVRGYAESQGLQVDGDMVPLGNYSKNIMRTLKYIDPNEPMSMRTKRSRGDENVAMFAYLEQRNMLFFTSGAHIPKQSGTTIV